LVHGIQSLSVRGSPLAGGHKVFKRQLVAIMRILGHSIRQRSLARNLDRPQEGSGEGTMQTAEAIHSVRANVGPELLKVGSVIFLRLLAERLLLGLIDLAQQVVPQHVPYVASNGFVPGPNSSLHLGNRVVHQGIVR
jgi:hypothetical protein